MTGSRHAVVGMGEVGKAHASLLKKAGLYVWEKDMEDREAPREGVQVMHVALNYRAMGDKAFKETVVDYVKKLRPKVLSILSTVPPGTTESFERPGLKACHSTTRGLHPNLETGLRKVTKHVGGPDSEWLAAQFARAGIPCLTHRLAISTEVAHLLNNMAYGMSLMFADEAAKLCRHYGVDFFESVMKYTATHNAGFTALDQPRLVRSVLMPPGGKLGGHCVVQSAQLIPKELRGPMARLLAGYNGETEDEVEEQLNGEEEPAPGCQGDPDLPGVRQDGDALHVDVERAAEVGGAAGPGAEGGECAH